MFFKSNQLQSGSTEEKTPTATVQVQQQQSEASGENVSSSNANSSGENTHDNSAENDDSEVFEDPTQPQPLEGRFAGLEAMFGNPQMTLAESISAGILDFI